MSKLYCPFLYLHQTISTVGDVQPCCMAMPPDKETKLEWASLDFKEGISTYLHDESRDLMEQGKWPKICEICKVAEHKGVTSHREKAIMRFGNVENIHIKYIDIKFSNTCNLGCRMCKPSDSSVLADYYKDTLPEDRAHYLNQKQFKRVYIPDSNSFQSQEKLEYVKHLVKNGLEIIKVTGGEPLADKHFMELVDWIVDNNYASQIEVNFTTNATKVNKPLLKKLSMFRKIKIVVSIDGTGTVYEYIRHKADWKSVKQNIIFLSECINKNFKVELACIYQFYNILNLKDLIDFGLSNNLAVNVNEVLRPLDSELSCFNISQNIKKEVKKMRDDIVKEHWHTTVYSGHFFVKEAVKKLDLVIKADTYTKDKQAQLYQSVIRQDKMFGDNFKESLHPAQIEYLERINENN